MGKKYLCGFDVKYSDSETQAHFLAVTFVNDVPNESNGINTLVKEVSQEGFDVKDCFLICDKNLKVLYKNETLHNDDLVRAFDWLEENSNMGISEA